MHLLDYIVLSVIFVWLIAAICYIIRQKKAGRSTCGGDCAGCQKRCAQAGVKQNENSRSGGKLS
ncbi:FeoB-associated Cys-rich membrane protein [Sporobacter termitidis]|uniref:FeoB-associated Cys-rich membrane protein n=1 Tax=Sporobacter termitidis TaxID=44749 RepID=UPI000933C368